MTLELWVLQQGKTLSDGEKDAFILRVATPTYEWCLAHTTTSRYSLTSWWIPLHRESSYLSKKILLSVRIFHPTHNNLIGCNVLHFCMFTSLHTWRKPISRCKLSHCCGPIVGPRVGMSLATKLEIGMGLKWHVFLILDPYIWLVCGLVKIKEQTSRRTLFLEKIELRLQNKLITNVHAALNTIGRTYVFN